MALAPRIHAVTIPSGSATTPSVSVPYFTGGLVGIRFPAAMDGTLLTFQTSNDGSTAWKNVYDASGTQVEVTYAADRQVALDPAALVGFTYLRAVTNVNQTADRDLELIFRELA